MRKFRVFATKTCRKMFAILMLGSMSFGVLMALLLGVGAVYYSAFDVNHVAATECTQYFVCLGIPMIYTYVGFVTSVGENSWFARWINY